MYHNYMKFFVINLGLQLPELCFILVLQRQFIFFISPPPLFWVVCWFKFVIQKLSESNGLVLAAIQIYRYIITYHYSYSVHAKCAHFAACCANFKTALPTEAELQSTTVYCYNLLVLVVTYQLLKFLHNRHAVNYKLYPLMYSIW